MEQYVLNLNIQDSGDYEIHKEGCSIFPVNNFNELGNLSNCISAVKTAKNKHPYKKN